jgi:RNA polymerase sigma-70 factor (ECF subfamily)
MYNEKELIRECISGNRRAEKQLFDQYSAKFFGMCLRYADSREEAEDLLVGGFVLIFKHLTNYKAKGSFEGWMKRIMINHAIDKVRNRHAAETVPIGELPLDDRTTAENIQHKLDAQAAMKAIRQLPPTLRTIFNLYVVEGYTHKEIARELQMNESTVRVYFSKAKVILQKKLTENTL